MAMFGVRIWSIPIHSNSSLAASLRFAWLSPTLFGTARLLPQRTLLNQHYPAVRHVQLPPALGVRSIPNQTGAKAGRDRRSSS
jgi:hypothetical protein